MKNIIRPFILLFVLSSCSNVSWRDAPRDSVGLAPLASEVHEDIFQIYYARAFSWRGAFGVHPWLAWKKTTDSSYKTAQVISWNLRRNGSALSVAEDLPDRMWYGSKPTLLLEVRGAEAKKIISQVEALLKTYPFQQQYKVWPGPNSNTFVAYIMRNIDEIKAELPPHAIGKDYLGQNNFASINGSSTGFILSAYGVLGLNMGLREGVEVNLFGLYFGIDLWTPALKLPIVGRVGFPDVTL